MYAASVFRRVCNMIFSPQAGWLAIAGEENTSLARICACYALPLAAAGPLAYFAGVALLGIHIEEDTLSPLQPDSPMAAALSFVFSPQFSFDAGPSLLTIAAALRLGLMTYAGFLLTLVLLGLLLYVFAPLMGGVRNFRNASKAAIYSSIPAWIAGLSLILPKLFMIFIIGTMYSLYVLYGGVKVLLKVSEEDAAMLVGMVVFCLLLLSQVAGYAAGSLGLIML